MYSISKNDVKQLAAQIEILSKEIQNNLEAGKDYLLDANRLVSRANTMVFALGELHAFEQSGKRIRAKSVSNPNRTYLRDAYGRFARKV